jgi:acetyltransferase-like isoleucine patch superfamily enzyme
MHIDKTAIIECESFSIGANSYIGPNVKITCKEFYADDYLYIAANVEVGRGGCKGPNSIVKIGKGVGIFEGTVINPSERVTIGDNVGIGAECLIWTHGAWLNPLDGFPASFDSCSIGSNVWLPARSIMLPGTNIGDNAVIGTASVITKDIPSGSLAMGSPCKVVKENYYPKKLSLQEKDSILEKILHKWFNELLPHRAAYDCISYNVKDGIIEIVVIDDVFILDTNTLLMTGHGDRYAEDLRDFLRRNGIKFFTGNPFKSMPPAYESNN